MSAYELVEYLNAYGTRVSDGASLTNLTHFLPPAIDEHRRTLTILTAAAPNDPLTIETRDEIGLLESALAEFQRKMQS